MKTLTSKQIEGPKFAPLPNGDDPDPFWSSIRDGVLVAVMLYVGYKVCIHGICYISQYFPL